MSDQTQTAIGADGSLSRLPRVESPETPPEASQEASDSRRFAFGKNWRRFLSVVGEDRIVEAEKSLQKYLGMESLRGRTFLDVGSGSGLFALAARRLGATVHSFDYDSESVACTRELKGRYFASDCEWIVEQGSILDPHYVARLGSFDIVYSWGVLHHTGAMWEALANVSKLVRPGGRLMIAIYNDQGKPSLRWRRVKRTYCAGRAGKIMVVATLVPLFVGRRLARDLLHATNPLRRYRSYKSNRGMSLMTDLIDWLGGYPFEVAKPEEIIDFYFQRGYVLTRLRTCGGGSGCNEFVFERTAVGTADERSVA